MSDSDQGLDARHYYQDDRGRAYHYGKRRLPEAGLPWVVEARRKKFGTSIRQSDVVVEFGVGAGWNLRGLQCERRIGIDVAEFLSEELEIEGIEFVSDSASISSGTADVVICHHMLEHVESPIDTLREIRRVLKPGGTLLLHTPYEIERRWRQYRPGEPNHHLFSWNPQTLGALVELTGLSVESAGIGPYGYDRVAADLAVRSRTGEGGYHMTRRLLHLVKPVREVRIVASAPA